MAKCRSCGASIQWVRTENGKLMPVEPDDDGNIVLDATDLFGDVTARFTDVGTGTHVSHFATCPDAESWRS